MLLLQTVTMCKFQPSLMWLNDVEKEPIIKDKKDFSPQIVLKNQFQDKYSLNCVRGIFSR